MKINLEYKGSVGKDWIQLAHGGGKRLDQLS